MVPQKQKIELGGRCLGSLPILKNVSRFTENDPFGHPNDLLILAGRPLSGLGPVLVLSQGVLGLRRLSSIYFSIIASESGISQQSGDLAAGDGGSGEYLEDFHEGAPWGTLGVGRDVCWLICGEQTLRSFFRC